MHPRRDGLVRGRAVPARWGVAALGALVSIHAPQAQVLDIVLPPDTTIVDSASAPDGGFWLQTATRLSSRESRYGLTKVSPDLEIAFERALPESAVDGIVAFRDGVLALSVSGTEGGERRLLWIGPEPDAPIEPWYPYSYPSVSSGSIVPALDGSAVYMAADDRRLLSKIAPGGAEQWREAISEGQLAGIVATPEGIAGLLRYAGAGSVLAAWSADGAVLWRSEIESPDGAASRTDSWDRAVSVSPRTLLLLRPPTRYGNGLVPTMSGPQELVLFDSAARAVGRRLTIPIVPRRVVAAFDGFLYLGTALRQPFVALFGSDGEIRWSRRLDLGQRPVYDEAFRDILPLGRDRIALVIGTERGAEMRYQIVAADAQAPAFPQDHGLCVSADALAIVDRELRIRREFGITATLGADDVTSRPIAVDGCDLPTDADYLRFLTELVAELERLEARPDAALGEIYVAVDAYSDPFRLEGYRFNTQVLDGDSSSVHYYANANAARPLARHLVETLRPHLERMRAAVGTVHERTGCHLWWDRHALSANPEAIFRATEQGVERVVAAARLAAQETGVSTERRHPLCNFTFDETGFGGSGRLRPWDRIGDTMREIFAYFRQP